MAVHLVLLFAGIVFVAGVCGQPTPVFDGVIRPTSDGREEAYLTPPFVSNHASNIEMVPNQAGQGVDMLVAWFSGTQEGASGVSIVMSRLIAGSKQWSNATVMSHRDGYSNQNPVIFYYNGSAESKIVLFHSQQKASEGESQAEIWALESGPDGLNWTQPKPLFTKPGSFDRNRVIFTLNNTALLPIYYAVKGNENQTSSLQEWIRGDFTNINSWKEHGFYASNYLVQPTVVRPIPGNPKLITFFRDRRRTHIFRAVSTDDGKSWSAPSKTTLPNNNSGIQACALTSGNIALVYNPTNGTRNPLVISLSEDDGVTWKYTRILIESPEPKGIEYSYPSILQDVGTGAIHITHTYNRQTIKYNYIPNENWIKAGGGTAQTIMH